MVDERERGRGETTREACFSIHVMYVCMRSSNSLSLPSFCLATPHIYKYLSHTHTQACGFVSEVDSRLKLNTFILKNPPENKLSKAEKKVKKLEKERMKGLDGGDKEEKKKKKKSSKSKTGEDEPADDEAAAANGDDDADADEDDDDDEVVWMTDTSEAAMEALLHSVCEEMGLKLGKVGGPLRVALTGKGFSPGMGEMLALLGKERTLPRLDAAIAHLEAKG